MRPLHILFDIKPGSMCISVMSVSIALEPDNTLKSCCFYGRDADGELDHSEWVRHWAYLARELAKHLDEPRAKFCKLLWTLYNNLWGEEVTKRECAVSYFMEPHPEGFSSAWAEGRQMFASDAVLMIATLPTGVVVTGMNGRTGGPLTIRVWWQVWAVLSQAIAAMSMEFPILRTLPFIAYYKIINDFEKTGAN